MKTSEFSVPHSGTLNITNHTTGQVTNVAPMAEQQHQQNLAEASVVVLELCGKNLHKQNDSTKLH